MKLLLYLGPDKSGSTYLYNLVSQHPQVSDGGTKEHFFWDRYYRKGVPAYLNRFGAAPVGLDVSHDYLFSVEARSRLQQEHLVENTYGVSLVRDPLDRALSAYRYMRWQGRTVEPFERAIWAVPELMDHGDVGRWIAPWSSLLGDRLLVRPFEDLVSRPKELVAEVLHTVSLPPVALDLDVGRNERPSTVLPPLAIRTLRRAGETLRGLGLVSVHARLKRQFLRESGRLGRRKDPPGQDLEGLQRADRDELLARLMAARERMVGLLPSETLEQWSASWVVKLG